MAIRAKFRCNAIRLCRTSVPNPEAVERVHGFKELTYAAAAQACEEAGIEQYVTFDQPTVELTAVATEPGNESWASATPNGKLEITISNPAAAEQFELGESYYVDFTHAGH